MTALDRRTFLRGLVYGLLGAVLGWEIEAIAATEAAPAEEELGEICDGLDCTGGYMYIPGYRSCGATRAASDDARAFFEKIMSLQGDKG